jgi:hypothetical protein
MGASQSAQKKNVASRLKDSPGRFFSQMHEIGTILNKIKDLTPGRKQPGTRYSQEKTSQEPLFFQVAI